jgi:hypothetical protein
MLTIERTITIPKDRHIRLEFDAPEAWTSGTYCIKLIPEAEELKNTPQKQPARSYGNIEEALRAAEAQRTPDAAAEFTRVMNETRGSLADSEVWGRGIDVDAKIRAMRDEWERSDLYA